jgi:DNA transformation protein and related proteins
VAVSDSYRAFVLEQLQRAVPLVRARRMFGGVGLYSGDVFFALIDDDVLYLKTDASTEPTFESRGMKPFRPFGDDGAAMAYHQLPEDVLENPDELREWAERAIAVARKKKGGGHSRRRRT